MRLHVTMQLAHCRCTISTTGIGVKYTQIVQQTNPTRTQVRSFSSPNSNTNTNNKSLFSSYSLPLFVSHSWKKVHIKVKACWFCECFLSTSILLVFPIRIYESYCHSIHLLMCFIECYAVDFSVISFSSHFSIGKCWMHYKGEFNIFRFAVSSEIIKLVIFYD